MSLFPRFSSMVPVFYRHRHAMDRWPSHISEMEKLMENLSPTTFWNVSSPFYVEYERPEKCRHHYVEYKEFGGKEDGKRKDKEKKEGTVAEKTVEGAVEEDKKKFKVSFGAKQFKPEEIKVRLSEDQLIVEGVQETDDDEGYFSRRFIRRYTIPKNIDVRSFKSHFSKDGVLSIEAEKLEQTEPETKYIEIQTETEGKFEAEHKD